MPEQLGSMEVAESEKPAESNLVGGEDSGADSDGDQSVSTVLVEVTPGVAVVFGKVPVELTSGLIDFGLVSPTDRSQVSAAVASVAGNSAAIGGELGRALQSAQGLYKVNAATQGLLNSGASFAVKDGANLGAIWLDGKLVAQARFIPVAVVGAAQVATTIGPAVAMIGLQVQLSQLTGLVNTNLALTRQGLTMIRREQWAELTGLAAAIDRALDQAREIGSVPSSLWDTVAGSEPDLRKQLDLYRSNVGEHVKQIEQLRARHLREYLETNAEAVLFDAYALLSSLKAWTTYQGLRAAKARASGSDDVAEAQLVDIIARDTRLEFESALAATTSLVDSLTRELRIIAELPGRAAMPLARKRKDSRVARAASAQLLEAVEPLAAALHPVAFPIEAPEVVVAPNWLDVAPYLRILRWLLEDGETLRGLGFLYEIDARDLAKVVGQKAVPLTVGAIGAAVKLRPESEKWTEAVGKATASTVVAVTDRRVMIAKSKVLSEQGEISQDIPIDQVRYVRLVTARDENERPAIDLITRDDNIRWVFHADTDSAQVGALAALLAESMAIPEVERAELLGRRSIPVTAKTGSADAEPAGSHDQGS